MFTHRRPRGEGCEGPDDDPVAVDVPGFVILGECGRGGMGVVCLAEQAGLGRRVAIKFLRPELAGAEAQRARFRGEARALARLQHPNIVQVFDSGEHAGRFYIVEEYVRGGSLDQSMARKPLGARAAAEMVVTLARAVQHAHEKHVVHRDLKPANVLLDDDGCPKISDFGLAKQLDHNGLSGQTESGTILGSPSYMAPEQIIGRKGRVGPPADLYALGAILYEMLTGRPPFLAASLYETLALVRTVDCVPPSRLQPGLPRDLETVCVKCLAKDPSRRYPTALALADDLERFLQGRPILARPAPAGERFVKWVRRRPATAAGFGVACLAAAALLIGGVTYEVLLQSALERAQANERRADQRYRVASDTMHRMVDRSKDPRFAQTPRLRELLRLQLEDALQFYGEVLRDRADPDPAVRFEFAKAALQAASIQEQLDRKREASEALNEAVPLLESLARAAPGRTDYRFALAQSYRMRARVGNHTAGLADKGASSRADQERAIGMLEDLVHADPSRGEFRSELGAAHHDLGVHQYQTHENDPAERHFRRAVELYSSLLDASPSPRDVTARVALAATRRNLAIILQVTKQREEASREYAASRGLLLDVLSVEPDRAEAALALGGTLFNWAIFLSYQQGEEDRVGTLFGEAIDRLSAFLKREPEWGLPRQELRSAHGARAQWLEGLGRHGEAVRDWERVVELADPVGRDHYRFFLATARARAGDHRGAWELVRALKPCLANRAADYYTHLATVCSLAVAKVEADQSLPPAERTSLAASYAHEGVDLLRRALDLTPEAARATLREALRTDGELAPLRRLPEVKALTDDEPGLRGRK
jgi:tetratricopeptide (TPR) repeat protein